MRRFMSLTKRRPALVCASAALLALLAADVRAQQIDGSLPDSVVSSPDDGDTWKFTVGAGPAVVPDYEGSDDYDFVPLPIFRAGKGPMYVQLLGAKITSNLVDHERWRLGPLLNFRRKRGDVDNNQVSDMKTVDATAELGFKAGYDAPLPGAGGVVSFEVEFAHDIGDEHDGWTLGPQITFKRMWDKRWNFALQSGFDFASDDYMETYFGVSASDSARSGLPQYSPDGGAKDYRFAAALTYKIDDNWGVGGIVQWKQLIGDANDKSPVVDVGSQSQAIAGLFATYTFNN